MFKVGDKIIFAAMGNSVMEYQQCLEVFISQGLIRHATAEEIAVGHRIDHFVDANNMVDANAGVTVITPKGTSKVKGGLTAFIDMGDDSHIENHISKNCKVIEHEA